MSSPAVDVAGLMIAYGLGTLGTDIFIGRDPGGTSQTITLYDLGGPSVNPAWARDFIDLQISVWGATNDYTGGYSKAVDIKNYLLGLAAQTIGTKTYFAFNMRSNIALVNYDNSNRPEFMMLFRIIIDDGNVGNRLSL